MHDKSKIETEEETENMKNIRRIARDSTYPIDLVVERLSLYTGMPPEEIKKIVEDEKSKQIQEAKKRKEVKANVNNNIAKELRKEKKTKKTKTSEKRQEFVENYRAPRKGISWRINKFKLKLMETRQYNKNIFEVYKEKVSSREEIIPEEVSEVVQIYIQLLDFKEAREFIKSVYKDEKYNNQLQENLENITEKERSYYAERYLNIGLSDEDFLKSVNKFVSDEAKISKDDIYVLYKKSLLLNKKINEFRKRGLRDMDIAGILGENFDRVNGTKKSNKSVSDRKSKKTDQSDYLH